MTTGKTTQLKSIKLWNHDNQQYPGRRWKSMKLYGSTSSDGVVFLPAAGYRYGHSYTFEGIDGFYWSSTANDGSSAYYVNFYSKSVYPDDCVNHGRGYSVRLITDVN